jgi:hypothetical protein
MRADLVRVRADTLASPTVQLFGRQVCIVGPNDSATLLVNASFREEGRILQRFEHTPASDDVT